MNRLLRGYQSRDPRVMLAVILGVLLVTMAPHGVLSGNEEQYLAEAWRTVSPSSWPAASNLLGGFPHAVIFNRLLGSAVDALGFSGAQALGRMLAIALYAVALLRLFRVLALSAGDLLFVLVAFLALGESLVGNEWMFRGIEPKVLAYGLVLLALTELLLERPGRCYALLVPATYLHAFAGGFWAIIFTVVLLAMPATRRRSLVAGALAALAMLPFLWFLLGRGYAQFDAVAAAAAGPSPGWIVTYVAYPWHTTPFVDLRSFVRWTPGILGTIAVAVAALVARSHIRDQRSRTLALLVFLPAAWVLLALALTWVFDDGRLGVFVLFRPSGLGLLIALTGVMLWARTLAPSASQWMRLGMLAVALPAAAPAVLQLHVYPVGRDLMRTSAQQPLVQWIRSETAADSVFMIDPDLEETMLDFERRTGRASLFMHRFTPGGAGDLREWYRRQQYRTQVFSEGCADARAPARVDYAIVNDDAAHRMVLSCGRVVHQREGLSVVRMGVSGG